MTILFAKKKTVMSIAYHQAQVFKRFKDNETFIKVVNGFKLHKSTIIFKMNIFKLIYKDPKLMKSSMSLDCLRNYYKDMKQICKENSNEFE